LDGEGKKTDLGLRVIIFSRGTAMVTIPPEVRDRMMLAEVRKRGHKVRVTFVPDKGYSGKGYPPKGYIEVRVEAARPGKPREKSV